MVKTLEKDEIREQVLKILETTELDQVSLAKRIGYSSPALSTYLKGKYEGNIENL